MRTQGYVSCISIDKRVNNIMDIYNESQSQNYAHAKYIPVPSQRNFMYSMCELGEVILQVKPRKISGNSVQSQRKCRKIKSVSGLTWQPRLNLWKLLGIPSIIKMQTSKWISWLKSKKITEINYENHWVF
jgi:hypothetical protein